LRQYPILSAPFAIAIEIGASTTRFEPTYGVPEDASATIAGPQTPLRHADNSVGEEETH
jgi:hypothetical protein